MSVYLKTREAAGYCGCGASTLANLRVSGGGPSYIKAGRNVLYNVNDLDAWLLSHRYRSTADYLLNAA